MHTEQWSLQDAKNQFSAVINAAQEGHPQIVTRRGVPTAVVLSIDAFEKFQQFEATQAPSLIDHLFTIPTDDGEFEGGDMKLRDIV